MALIRLPGPLPHVLARPEQLDHRQREVGEAQRIGRPIVATYDLTPGIGRDD